MPRREPPHSSNSSESCAFSTPPRHRTSLMRLIWRSAARRSSQSFRFLVSNPADLRGRNPVFTKLGLCLPELITYFTNCQAYDVRARGHPPQRSALPVGRHGHEAHVQGQVRRGGLDQCPVGCPCT
eukprot:4309945-Pleurochrysis_carterae.AAC.1